MTAGGPAPRVAFVGNVANSSARAARALRDVGVDAHVFVDARAGGIQQPEVDVVDDERWIHVERWITPRSLLVPAASPLARRLRGFDVVVASGPGPVFAQFAGRPWVFFVTGGDLTVKPFPLTFWRWYPNWSHRAAELVAGAWQRRACRRATELWLQPFAPMVGAASRLRIDPARWGREYIPLAVDTDAFAPDAPVDPGAERFVRAGVGDADFVVFHPSRLVIDPTPALVRTGQWKGNDVLVRGFARFVADGVAARPLLVLPDTTLSRDRERVRALVHELGLDAHVWWVRPPDGEVLDRAHMVALYRAAHVGVDELGVGWFGYVALETLATGRPVLNHVDEAVMAQLYPDGHPMLDVRTEAEVAARLTALASDDEHRRAVGRRSRAWVEEHHAGPVVADRYLAAIRRVLSDLT